MKLTVILPVYNERPWIEMTVRKVLAQKIPGIDTTEIIVVDDHSRDGTKDVVENLAKEFPRSIIPLYHSQNFGKGAAVRTAIPKISGDICVIQDGDLEYDPANYPLLLEPLINGVADCVYGSRFQGTQPKRVLLFWHYVGNRFLTILSNVCTNLNLTDMETGYKAFRSEILQSVSIKSNRFDFEPEITAKVAKKGCRIFEVGISYYGRTYREGKKITWIDGVKAVSSIIRFWWGD